MHEGNSGSSCTRLTDCSHSIKCHKTVAPHQRLTIYLEYHRGVNVENVYVFDFAVDDDEDRVAAERPYRNIHSLKWNCDESHLRWNGITFLHKIFASFFPARLLLFYYL